MPDPLGVSTQGSDQSPEGTSLDFLGIRSPTAFRGQPALPSGAGPAPGGAAPPTTAGGTAPAGPLAPTKSGALGETTFADLSSAVGGPGESAGQGPAVGEAGSFPASFDLASVNLGQLGVEGPLGGVGGRVGPTGNVGLTTGNKTVDSIMGLGAKLANIPLSQNLLSLAARLAPSVLGPLAASAGLAGLPLAFAQLVHSISTAIPGTTAFNIANMATNPDITPEEFHEQMSVLAQSGAFPMQGGPQPIGALPMDNPVSTLGQSLGTSTPGAGPTFGGQTLTETTLADLASSIFGQPSTAREDIGPTGPGTGPPGPPGLSESETAAAEAAGITGGEASGPGAPGPGDGGSGAP